ncbi:MAG: HAMP domain-containing histidine kinase [Clostridiaceae bacterium]|jgi:signal transduction histidine kinase|nr:HAMP domain-containing histidine kinase [Clostridiaceae bacterium]
MKRKISNQFLINFVVIFLLTVMATILAFVFLSLANRLITNSLVKNQFSASAIVKDDYTQIDASTVLRNGGGVQVLDREYRVVYSEGLDTIGKDKLTTMEFTSLLTNSKSQPYNYDILYHPEGDFWLIVTFPSSIRLDFSIIYNQEGPASDIIQTGWVIFIVGLLYLLIIAIITFIYSRITASRITIPLQKLCDGTKLLREGDYSARVDLKLKNEFAELQSTFNDMADRIEQEISLRKKSEEERRRLILDISHDLKNPMASIQGYAQFLMKKSNMTKQERDRHLKVIINNSKRASQLLSELFELSQMDSPEFSLKLVRTDICEYIRQICGELVPQLEREGFEYKFDISESSVFALVDIDRFGRIIQNLASNALRYNPRGTLITVRLIAQNRQVMIDFSDNGIGIPAQLADTIFMPFVRGDNYRNIKTSGSGLGLSIAKRIAEEHGGDLILHPIEKGSTFRITIPTN